MKNTSKDRVLLISVVFVAVSIILQVFAAKGLINNQIYNEEYTRSDIVDSFNKTPIPKLVLDVKFEQYKRVTDYGATVNLFNLLQYEEFENRRVYGRRTPLTIDEILYIIEDSIDLYFSYERVVFTGDTKNINPVGTSMYYFVGFSGDFSTFEEAYDTAITHISQMIWFRIMTHDAGLLRVIDNKEQGSIIICEENEMYIGNDKREMAAMIIDGETSIDDTYKNKLSMDLYTFLLNFDGQEIIEYKDSESIFMEDPALLLTFATKEIIMWDTSYLGAVKLFPLSSLEDAVKARIDL